MHAISKTLLTMAVSMAAFAVVAQESSVDLKNARQQQSGALNSQSANLGNASGSGKSKVKIDNFSQQQSGALNSQTLALGNASKGKSNVKADNVTQNQSGALNSQSLKAGNTN